MVRPISVLGTPSARPLKPFGVIVCLRILDLQLCPGVRASASETQAVVPGTVVTSPTPGRGVDAAGRAGECRRDVWIRRKAGEAGC